MSNEKLRFKIKYQGNVVLESDNKVVCSDLTQYISNPCKVCLIKAISKKIKNLRRVADLIGVNLSSVYFYLSGDVNPSCETTKNIVSVAMKYCFEDVIELLSQDFDNHEYLLDYFLRGGPRPKMRDYR